MKPPHTTAKINHKCKSCGRNIVVDFNPEKDGMHFDGITHISGFCNCGKWFSYSNPEIGR